MMTIVFPEIFTVSAQIGRSDLGKYFTWDFTSLLNERAIRVEIYDVIY